jgi:hypothetical protein
MTRDTAHGPAKWTPIRRQELAPLNESGARPDSKGTGRALVIAGAFALCAGLLPAGVALAPKAGAPVAVIAPPWAIDGEAVRIVAAADGVVVGASRRGGIVIATSAAADFIARLYQSGASVVIDAAALSTCLSIAGRQPFSAKGTNS